MNDKEKEAFENWLKDKLGVAPTPEDYENLVQFKEIIELGWQACCEYKQKEIDDVLIDANNEMVSYRNSLANTYTRTIEKLQAENAKLRQCVEFYADTNNWSFDQVMSEDIYRANGGKRARQVLKELDKEL